MSAYVIANLTVTDPEQLGRYAELVPATIEKYGGRYLVRGGKFDVIEGTWSPHLVVVLEFPSWDAALTWYNSEEYRPLKEMRMKSAHTDGVLVQGT